MKVLNVRTRGVAWMAVVALLTLPLATGCESKQQREENTRLKGQVASLTTEKAGVQRRVDDLTQENTRLKAKVDELTGKVKELEAKHAPAAKPAVKAPTKAPTKPAPAKK